MLKYYTEQDVLFDSWRSHFLSKDLTLEEMLEIASKPSSSTDNISIQDSNQIEIRKFIRAKDIQSSDNPIHARLIYDYYNQWSDTPLPYKTFVKYFTIYFKKSRSSENILFKVTPQSFGLPISYSFYRDSRFHDKQVKKSKYLGVYPIAGYYIARFKTEENTHYIGRFETEIEAATQYDLYSYLHFGITNKLNFPENKDSYEKEINKEDPKEKI